MTIIDLSHPIHDGMPAYPGLPPARVRLLVDHVSSRPRYEDLAEFAIGQVELAGNTGTYLDSPYHRYPDGADVSELPLEHLIDLPTVVIDASPGAERRRRLDLVLPSASLEGHAVLVRTGWSRLWGAEEYWQPGPYLGGETVSELVRRRPALVGVDFANVDDTKDPARPAHTRLLGAGIVIVEHLRNLEDVEDAARTSFVPLAVVGAPSVPIRAFAVAEER